MKGWGIFHHWAALFVPGIFACTLYAVYAAAVTAAPAEKKVPVKDTFVFSKEYEDDFNLQLITDGYTGKNEIPVYSKTCSPLEAFMEYSDKTLSISGTEAFNMEKFLSGSARISISYRMEEDSFGAEPRKAGEEIYDLGNVPFFLTGEEPYWRIANKNGSWGTGVPDIGIPDEVYRLLPQNITGLLGYNTVTSFTDGVLKGSVTIGQFLSRSLKLKSRVINLSSLKLPKGMNEEILAGGETGSILEIMANYYFSVPLILNQEENQEIKQPSLEDSYNLLRNCPGIQGKITLRMYVQVLNDMN